MSIKSKKYHDYVFKNGKLIGAFDDMYKNSDEIPWHQDETIKDIFSELDILILKHFRKHMKFQSIAEIGCGLGYVTARIKKEFSDCEVTGFDISFEAVRKAAIMFKDIKFYSKDILLDNMSDYYSHADIVIQKDVLWYVIHKADLFFETISKISKKYIFISQSFPEEKVFVGNDLLPNAMALERYLKDKFKILYFNLERDGRYAYREYVHILAEKR